MSVLADLAMKNNLITFGLLALIGSAAAGLHYRIPIVIVLVCLGLAMFSAVSGVQMIVTRKAEIPTSDSFDSWKEYHTGLSAQLWGVLFLIFSVPLGAFGVLYGMYGDDPPAELFDRMVRSPLISGLAIIVTGAAIGMYGLTRVLPGKAGFVETKIGPFERTLGAIYLTTVSALVVTAGFIRLLSPGTLTRLRDAGIAWVLELVKASN
jgi:hypothetical protein